MPVLPRFLACAVAANVFVAAAGTASAGPTIYVAPQIGSSGIGGSVAVRIDDVSEVSANLGSFVYHQQQSFNNNVVDISTSVSFLEKLQLVQGRITYDRRFNRRSPLVASAGVVLNDNHLAASSIPFTENVTIAGTVYSAATAGQAFADVRWRRFAPYVGVGYVPRGSGFVANAGVFYQGKPTVDISETGAIYANRNAIGNYIASFNSQLRQALSVVTAYPAVNVGYRVRI